jgi:hypothetical protein
MLYKYVYYIFSIELYKHVTPLHFIPPLFFGFWLQKKMDFTLKIVGGEISTLPGISDAIEVCTNLCSGTSVISNTVIMICEFHL